MRNEKNQEERGRKERVKEKNDDNKRREGCEKLSVWLWSVAIHVKVSGYSWQGQLDSFQLPTEDYLTS